MSISRKQKPKKRVKKDKPINWRLALKKSREKESREDAARAVALIKELHYLVLIKHGK